MRKGIIMKVSIIVPVFNQWRYTKQMLASLYSNNDMSNVEIIIIDNGSTDETNTEVNRMIIDGRRIVLLKQDRNLGVAKAWNIGLRQASGEYIIIMNNDLLIPKNFIKNYVTCFEKNPDVYAINPIHTDFRVPENFWKKSSEMADQPLNIVTTWGIAGFCFGIRRTVVEKIGFFDEQFGMMCYEDRDYMRRMKEAGLCSVQLTNVWVHHYRNRTLKGIPNRKKIIDENAERFGKKWSV